MNSQEKLNSLQGEKKALEGLLLSFSELLAEVIVTAPSDEINTIEGDILYYRGRLEAVNDEIEARSL